MSFLVNVGEKIKMRRLILGMTQSELARSMPDSLKLSGKQISRLETGTSGTGLETFTELAKLLGKTPDYFLLGSERSGTDAQSLIDEITENLCLCSLEDLKNILAIAKTFSNR